MNSRRSDEANDYREKYYILYKVVVPEMSNYSELLKPAVALVRSNNFF